MEQDIKLIAEKLFRIRENVKKIKFIVSNSDITFELIQKASVLARQNEYHNIGHEIGAAEQGIRIAIAEGKTREEINLIGTTLLFHDAGHTGIVRWYDEIHSVDLMRSSLSETDTFIMGSNHEAVMDSMQNLVLATSFPGDRGKNSNPLIRIIQDADLAHLGLGLYYWIWASMGLLDEFNKVEKLRTTPELFIHEVQEKFVRFVSSLSGTGKFFISEGAQKIFTDPIEVVKEFKNLPLEAIDFAYKVRRDDITVAEFTEQFNEFLVPA